MSNADYKTLVLEAAHSFLIHAPYVTPDKQLKWADTLLSAVNAIEILRYPSSAADTGGAPKELAAFEQDLHTMIYNPIEAIADAYLIWSTKKVRVSEQEIQDFRNTIDLSKELRPKDPVQAKRNLLGALNKLFEHLNKVDPSEKRQRLPFREELIPSA
jgi:hypothetical protein